MQILVTQFATVRTSTFKRIPCWAISDGSSKWPTKTAKKDMAMAKTPRLLTIAMPIILRNPSKCGERSINSIPLVRTRDHQKRKKSTYHQRRVKSPPQISNTLPATARNSVISRWRWLRASNGLIKWLIKTVKKDMETAKTLRLLTIAILIMKRKLKLCGKIMMHSIKLAKTKDHHQRRR